jgi:hypothetical protein
MKKILFIAVLGLMSLSSYAQGLIDLTVRWSLTDNRYEVYARPNFTSAAFTWGTSQVSVVVPAAAPDAPLSVVLNQNAGGWGTPNRVYAPAADATHDFHSFFSSGQAVSLTSGQEILLFAFKFSDALCRDGIRLFVNGSDPSSAAAGMQGGDYTNAIDNANVIGGAGVYNMNYNNTGTTCTTCAVIAPELIK